VLIAALLSAHVLASHLAHTHPCTPSLPLQVVASVVEELASRGGLSAALAGREEDSLSALLEHLRRHVADPRYTHLVAALAHRVLDM
jgi:hypothetical protein